MAGVDFDFSDVDNFFEQAKAGSRKLRERSAKRLLIMRYSMAVIRTEQGRSESQTNTPSRTKVWN